MSDFVYPYNFVPPAGRRRRSRRSGIGKQDSYRQLNRYGGKSGRITFTLTALSPLFIPDPEQTTYYRVGGKDEELYHRVMDFFNVDGRLAIPGASLRGMFRSVAEALSNSTYGVFVPDKIKLSKFRKTKDLDSRNTNLQDLRLRKWGRWTNDGEIEPLDTAKIWRSSFDAALAINTDEDRAVRYDAFRNMNAIVQAELWQLHTGNPHVRQFTGEWAGSVFSNTLTPVRTGQLQQRQVFKSEVVYNGKSFKGPKLGILLDALKIRGNGPWQVEFQTVLNVPNGATGRVEERVCRVKLLNSAGSSWDAERKTLVEATLWPRKGWADMESSAQEQSHYVAALYRVGTAMSVTEEAISEYRKANDAEPKPDDIVRYLAQGDKVVEFGPVAMFKTSERATVADLATKTHEIEPPRKNTELCSASRLFGWTPAKELGDEPEEEMPVAGRVRVGMAWSGNHLADTTPITLQILSSPRPGYYPFYLRPERGNDQDASTDPAYYTQTADPQSWWPTPGKLRGRKFYLHNPYTIFDPFNTADCRPSSQEEAVSRISICTTDQAGRERVAKGEPKQSGQNATAAVASPGVEFTGYVEFDSLDDHELGMLLWAISLADSPLQPSGADLNRAHKLGMGRPIGMGSVRVGVTDVRTFDPVGGWNTANDPGDAMMPAEEAARLVRVFKAWMLTGNDDEEDEQAAAFEREGFYLDLCDVLSLDLVGEGPVQYYPPNMPAYEGFDYFVSQRQQRNTQGEQPLRTPSELRANGGQEG